MRFSSSSTYHTLDRRTVAEIQKNIIKRSGRRGVSRVLHAWSDKNAISAWGSDLNRILHVFNVCSACFCLVVANYPPQIELAINIHNIVADMHRNTDTDIHQNTLKTRGDTDDRDCAMGGTLAL